VFYDIFLRHGLCQTCTVPDGDSFPRRWGRLPAGPARAADMLPHMSATFFLKLIPPRPTFAMDMSADERALMMQHVAYLGGHFKSGKVLVYGPVMAAGESFGMAILDVADEAEARSLMENDPTVIAKLNTYEIWPMRVGGAQARQS
jgi:uncharacterized protein